MSKKTVEIRYKAPLEHKIELDGIILKALGLNLAQGYHSLMELGLQTLREALIEGKPFKIEHIPNSRTQRIYFEEEK